MTSANRFTLRLLGVAALAATAALLGGCGQRNANQMTSYSSQASKSSTPQLFTIPGNQVSHVQVVTIAPGKITRTLRLTGAVAYNAFKTTPVISQVGGPVSRIRSCPASTCARARPCSRFPAPTIPSCSIPT